MPPESKKVKLGSSNQEGSPSAGENTVVVLVPYCPWKCVPTAISGGADISKDPECHLLQEMRSQRGSQKLLQKFMFHEFTAYLFTSDLFLIQWPHY